MTERERLERRLLILAPIGRDAALIERMLQARDVVCAACRDLESLLQEMARGAAAILLTEESIAKRTDTLAGMIAQQPAWSDIPVLLLTHHGANSALVARALDTLGSVTLLERPVHVAALVSAVRVALRARERQYEIRAHLDEREQADQRKDEFLATLAHELRNPLAPIRSSVTLLRYSGALPKVTEMLERQVGHMVRLVDDLMEVSRITRGKIELRKRAVDLATVIAAAVETSRPLIESADHALVVTLPPQPLLLEADGVRLAQVFTNLLNNAAKYTDPGGRISIAAHQECDRAVVTVTDTGVGIAPETLPKVFDMFVQADPRDRRSQTGLGIGLTIVRTLVEMHGGDVTAMSQGAGSGSAFAVRLPLGAAHDHVDGPRAPPAADIPALPRVMVVDDNRDAAESLGAVLQMLGAEVHVTHDGRAALDAYASFRPAAIFLDLGMPGMDGYEVARRLREQHDARDLVLVALTGWGQERDRRRTEAAGFNQHFVKPADLDAMRAVLASLTPTAAPR